MSEQPKMRELIPILCARITLRRFQEKDLAAFVAYRCDPEVARFQSWSSMEDDEARDFIRLQQRGQFGVPGEWFQIAIAQTDTDALIGDIGVCLKAGNPTCAEIGFTLSRENQGKGFAAEAVTSLVGTIFEHTGVDRLEAVTDTRNVKSTALLRRIGMKLEKTEQGWFKGSACSEYTFAILKKDWISTNAI
jgi:RimJ/RimL family protein N-acetyltransferase